MSVVSVVGAVLLVILLLPAFVGATIAILLSGRREPDPRGTRAAARYLGAVAFISVFVTLFATTAAVASLANLVVDKDRAEDVQFDDSSSVFGDDEGSITFQPTRTNDDANWRAAIQALLVAGASGAIFVFHARRRRMLLAESIDNKGIENRVDRSYLYTTCFFATLVILVGAASAAYAVFRMVAPGVAGAADATLGRQQGLQGLLTFGYLAVASWIVFRWHWSQRDVNPSIPDAEFV